MRFWPTAIDRLAAGRYVRAIASFLYLHCVDLGDVRRFYTDVVGLQEIFHSGDDGVVGYRVGDLQITVEEHPTVDDHAPANEWARQLGWRGGTGTAPSWGLELDATAFARAVEATIASGTTCWNDEPQWVGYWSFPVHDPMGHTVELSSTDPNAWPSGSD